MTEMQYLPVGNTGLRISVLGLGGAALSGLYGPVPEEQALATVQETLTSGLNFFDTAPIYGRGTSEQRLGRALNGVPRENYVLATKVGRLISPDQRFSADYTADGVRRSLEESLKRLNLERVDILHIHDADAEEHFRAALDQAFPALAELRRQGVIRAIGAGMNQWQRPAQFLAHADFDCFLVASRYTLLEHESLGFLDTCQARNVRVFLGGVFNTGILATGAVAGAKYNYRDAPPEIMARVGRIEQVCGRYCIPIRAVALQFPLAHPATSVIAGMHSAEEVMENTLLMRLPIPGELWADLKAEDLLPANVPIPVQSAAS